MDTHALAPDADAGPHCPACGFHVFNRRYPKCESCGAELPDTIAYTAQERHALLEADDALSREVARQHRPLLDPAPFGATGTADDSLLGALVDSSER